MYIVYVGVASAGTKGAERGRRFDNTLRGESVMNLLPFWKEGGYITNRYRDASQPVLQGTGGRMTRARNLLVQPATSTGRSCRRRRACPR
jgi:hypothetical protein